MTRHPDGPQLVHLGTAVIDVVVVTPRLPEPGGAAIARGATLHPGGAVRVMVAAARQGLPVTYGGMHGTGQYAEVVHAALRDEGISVVQPPEPELDTGVLVTFVEPDGRRTYVSLPGAEARLAHSALARVHPRPGDLVLVTGHSFAHSLNRAALTAWLPQLDPRVVVALDPGPLAHLLPDGALDAALYRADWVTVGLGGAQVLTGEDDAESAGRALSRRTGRSGVLVREGVADCVLVAAGEEPVVVPSPDVTVVDWSGADAAHTGTFLAELARGVDPVDAARRANHAAALCATRPGPESAPTRRELDQYWLARESREPVTGPERTKVRSST